MSDSDDFYKFVYSLDNYNRFEELSAEECKKYLKVCDEKGFFVQEIICFTSKEEYFQVHVWCAYFCEDYLVEVDGWHWKAFEHQVSCYEKEVLSKEPDNHQVFYLGVSKSQPDDDDLAHVNEMIAENMANPNFKPRDFGTSKQVKMLEVE